MIPAGILMQESRQGISQVKRMLERRRYRGARGYWKIHMIRIKEISSCDFSEYDKIPMLVHIRTEYRAEKIANGLGGILLKEVEVPYRIKNLGKFCIASKLQEEFDISKWSFNIAYKDNNPVAGYILALQEPKLIHQKDIAILWDLRVKDDERQQGIGAELVLELRKKALSFGINQIRIECQNNNVIACKFYEKMGAELISIRENAYWYEKECEEKIELMWNIDLNK